MSSQKHPKQPDLKDVEPGSDADETPTTDEGKTLPAADTGAKSSAAAMPEGRKPGPKDSPVRVRDSGAETQTEAPKEWDEVDVAIDESFPASDASAKY